MGPHDPTPPIQLLLVDDHVLFRDALAHSLRAELNAQLCGAAATLHEAVKVVGSCAPSVILMDIHLERQDGIEVLRELRTHFPKAHVLVLSDLSELVYAERVIRAGASGYLTKRATTHELHEAIRRVHNGSVHVSAAISDRLVNRVAGNRAVAPTPVAELLSDRELHVFRCIGQGMSIQEIANSMFLSVKTAETYRTRIKKKLRLKDRWELLKFAIQYANGDDLRTRK